MKLKYTYLTGILAAAMLTACSSENIGTEPASGDTGMMTVNVQTIEPQATRANTQVYDFPVIVKDAEGSTVKSYDRADAVPSSVTLGVGNYTVESHTPGDIEKRMDKPYYAGSADMEIMKGLTTNVDVICKMLNSSIKLNYDADFIGLFTSWTITIDDGSETALSFTNEDGNDPTEVYWYFENEPATLTLQFKGTTNAGATINATRQLSKDDTAVQQHYDDDKANFGGGDKIVINFSPVESTSGNVTEIVINADVTFAENPEIIIPVDVTDAKLTPGEDPNDGDDPTPAGNITLNLPAPISYPFLGAATVDKSLGDTYIAATKGLKSIKVKLSSTSEEMVASVSELNTNYGVDFLGGAEIVGNQDVVTLFQDLNQPLSVPAEGDTEYTFPIGNFFDLLQVLAGEHTFQLTVTDMDGNTKSGQVVITITM